jgi:uncharacterized protein YdaU (DUF1376 family)
VNYYPFHIGDFARDTSHLSILEEGAYRRMLDLYYSSERQLPKNREAIYRLVRAKSRQEKLVVDTLLGEFFIETPKGWRHERCEAEISKAKEKSAKAAESATVRWHGKRNANAMRTHSEGNAPNNQKPITNNQKKETKEVALQLPEWLPADAWKAYLEVRKQKKTPNTPRALNMLITELTRLKSLGFDPAAVLDQSTLKGWKSVFPTKPELVAVNAEPKAQLCDYCTKESQGTVNGRRACTGHWQLAMDNERPALKVAI